MPLRFLPTLLVECAWCCSLGTGSVPLWTHCWVNNVGKGITEQLRNSLHFLHN